MNHEGRSRTGFRRRHEDVRLATRRATLDLIEGTSFNDLSVGQIARGAGLSRGVFYAHFHGKHDALMAALDDVADELHREADRWWRGEGPHRTLVREALLGIASVWRKHASLMRVAVEVATYDAEFGVFWRELVGRFVSATADHIRSEQAAGGMRRVDPDATAEALVSMTEHCCYLQLSRAERSPEQLVEMLTPIWLAALYPDAG